MSTVAVRKGRNEMSLSEKFVNREITIEEYFNELDKERPADRRRKDLEKRYNKISARLRKEL